MTTLEKIFSKCKEFKILPCLDESYSYTDSKVSFPKKYIGCIYSVSNIDEILESISEEGSSTINYKIKSEKYTEKIINIFCTILIEYGFDPYTEFKYDKNDLIVDNNVSIVISYKDLFGDKKYEDDDETLSTDDDEKTEDETDDESVPDDEVVDKKEESVLDESVYKKEPDDGSVDKKEPDDEVVDEKEPYDEHVDKKEPCDDDDEVEDVDTEKEDEVEIKNVEEEYTYEKLKKKYRQELLDLARDLGISTWKNKNIQKHLKSDIIECIMNQKK